ncbi:lipopolysaccharide biosynthesis protein [Luteococcus peritonei]|uniref:Lipopolysaccharide biosynthesis protein n=1 Tax=Luteococcus peritonei TaxID=88874 RepID=A0ABW4RTU6_9ACTN
MKKQRSIWVTIGSTAGLKVIVMGIGGVLGMINTKLILAHFGKPAYAQYGLLASLPSLLPFASLGMAAVVINAVSQAEDPREDREMARTLTTALRYLVVSAGVIILVGLLPTLLGAWPAILGKGLLPGGGVTTFWCLVIFAVTLPMTIFPRMVIALGRPQAQVLSGLVVAPFMLASIVLLAWTGWPAGNAIAVLTYVANALAAAICLLLAWRSLGPNFRRMVRDVPRTRAVPNADIMGLAWPQLAQMMALPIAMQTDRLLLSHLADDDALAQYNMSSQFFQMLVQTITAAGVALWPMYAKARAEGRVVTPWRTTWIFSGIGLASGLALAGVIPWISHWLSDGKIVLSWWLIGGFAFFVVTQAANYPLGMYMTDEKGLKFQVLPIVIMVPVNLAISFWLTTRIGAGGPIIGSSIAVVLCQVLPNLFYVRRDIAERRALAQAPGRGADEKGDGPFDQQPGEEIAEQELLEGPRQP